MDRIRNWGTSILISGAIAVSSYAGQTNQQAQIETQARCNPEHMNFMTQITNLYLKLSEYEDSRRVKEKLPPKKIDECYSFPFFTDGKKAINGKIIINEKTDELFWAKISLLPKTDRRGNISYYEPGTMQFSYQMICTRKSTNEFCMKCVDIYFPEQNFKDIAPKNIKIDELVKSGKPPEYGQVLQEVIDENEKLEEIKTAQKVIEKIEENPCYIIFIKKDKDSARKE